MIPTVVAKFGFGAAVAAVKFGFATGGVVVFWRTVPKLGAIRRWWFQTWGIGIMVAYRW
jgi:hypothetical protein